MRLLCGSIVNEHISAAALISVATASDRLSDLPGQAPGARARQACAQQDGPAHRDPSCLTQFRFIDSEAHPPVAYRWADIGANDRITLKGGELKQTRLILDRAPPFRGELELVARIFDPHTFSYSQGQTRKSET